MKCTHCDKTIGCGCNKAVAGDGSTVCKGCLNAYNEILTTQQITIEPSRNVLNNSRQVNIPPTTAR